MLVAWLDPSERERMIYHLRVILPESQFGIQAWDIAAAVVILHEAGGLAVDPAAFNGKRT